MKLPKRPNKIKRMWWMIQYVHEKNRLGNYRVLVDPAPWAFDQYKKLKRRAERRVIRTHRKEIRETRIGLWKALKMIWNT